MPAASLFRDDLTMRGPAEIRRLLEETGVRQTSKAITYCGVGVSASALLFAMRLAGVEDVALYDASWEEWGRDPDRPVARD